MTGNDSNDLNLAVGRVFQESGKVDLPLTLADMVRLVCERPRMFTYEESFRSVAIYIDGFAAGRGAQDTMERFRSWLAQFGYATQGLPRNHVWQWYLDRLYATDEERFAAFPGLFDRFLQEAP